MSRLLRWLISAGLIGWIVIQHADPLIHTLAQTQPLWIALALLLSIGQVLLSAWRWRFTALQLNTQLGLRRAVAEYYLAMLINQVLPGGVVGDAQRAWRHGKDSPRWQPAAQAVVIERLAGQFAILVFILLSWPWLPLSVTEPIAYGAAGLGLLVLSAFALKGRMPAVVTGSRFISAMRDWGHAVRVSLFSPRVLPVQLGVSLVIAASYIAIYVCCVLAIGASGHMAVWLPLLPLVLIAMLIPVSVGGLGLREGAAAMLWPLAGLPAAEGIAAALLYGGVCLLASMPGVWVISKR